jgi:hypothetical protein
MTSTATASTILNAAVAELGLPLVSLTTSTGDTLAQQSLALLNALGDELIRIHDWQFLEQVMNFTGDGILDTFLLPSDFKRQINQTQWDKSARRPMMGPDSPQIWSWSQYGIVSAGVMYRYRILDNEYTLFPVPSSDEEFALYYISKNWVIDGADPNIKRDAATAPGDIPMFDKRLMITGLKVKLWAAKGFDTTALQEEFQFVLNAEKGQNQGAREIGLSGNNSHFYLNYLNIPESGYGL